MNLTPAVTADKLIAPRIYIAIAASMFAVYLLIELLGSNQSWFFAVNAWSAQYFNDAFSAHMTELGNGAIVGVMSVALLVRNPELGKRLLITTLLTAIVMYSLKHAFALPRPAGVLALGDFHLIGDVLKKYSFPSGHSTTAFALAGFVMLAYQHIAIRVSVLLLAIVAGWARIAVGAHWPEDVFAGAALGLSLAFIAALLCRTPFSATGNYASGLFLSIAALAGNYTLPADFPEIASIGYSRDFFALAAMALLFFFFSRLITELRPSSQPVDKS